MRRNIAVLLLAMCASLARAEESVAPPASAAAMMQAAALRDPEFKTYRAFVRGIDTFERRHAALAPAASLRFRLVPSHPGDPLDTVTMRIASDSTSLGVPVNADGSFAMPRHDAAAAEDAEIFLNKKRGSYRWRPDVHTADLPPGTRRLGDLRLECEVRWAAENAELAPQFVPGALSACLSGQVSMIHLAPGPLQEYSLVSGERRQKFIPAKDDRNRAQAGFTVPLHDASWPDDTLIEFVYVPQA